MPSIAEQLQGAVQDFADFNKKMIGPEALGGAMRQFELMIKKNADMLSDLNKSGELTEDAFKALDKQIEKTAVKGFGKLEKDTLRKHFKVIEEASKAMNKWTGGLKESIRSITKYIPLVGDKIAASFDKVIDKKIAPRLQKAFMSIFGKKGGGGAFGGLSLGKMGLWGGIALALVGIVKSLNMAENQLVAIVKGAGFLRKDIRGLVKDTEKYEKVLMSMGASFDEITQTQIALINQFGRIKEVTGEMVNTAQKLQLALGLSVDESAEMVETMTRGWKATNKEIDHFTANVAANANIYGVGLSIVMRNITKDANLLALYTKETSWRLAEAAIQSQAIGVDLSDTVGFADQFLDFGEASEKSMKMRLVLGTKLDALQVHDLSMRGESAKLQRIMGKQMVASGKWSHLEYGEKKKIAQEIGTTADYLQKTYNLGLLTEKEYQKQLVDQAALNKLTVDNRTVWGKVYDTLKSLILPMLKGLGTWLETGLTPIVNKIALKIQGWFAPKDGDNAWATFATGFGKVFDYLGMQLVKVLNYALDKIGKRSAILGLLLGSSASPLGPTKKLDKTPGSTPYSMRHRMPLGATGDTKKKPTPGDPVDEVPQSNGFINDFAEWTPFTDLAGYLGFAKGGIVTRPTKAIIGEAGPEMVIPLDGKGLDYSQSGGFKFARGAFIMPLGGGGSSTATAGGRMTAAGDPIARMERRREASELVKSRAKQRKELVEYWKKEEGERKKKKRDYRTFRSGVSTFGKGVSAFGQFNDILKEHGFDFKGKLRDAIVEGLPEGLKDFADSPYGGAIGGAIEGYMTGGLSGGLRGAAQGYIAQGGTMGQGPLSGGLGGALNAFAQGGSKSDVMGAAMLEQFGANNPLGQLGLNIMNTGSVRQGAAQMMGGYGQKYAAQSMKAFGKGGAGMGAGLKAGGMAAGASAVATALATGDVKAGLSAGYDTAASMMLMSGNPYLMAGGAAMMVGKKYIGGAAKWVGSKLGIGSKAKIETSWHPALLYELFNKGYKLRDKVKKKEIAQINQSIFGTEKIPGSKDGFSMYDVQGAEENREKQMAKTADWKSWALGRSSQIWGVPQMATGGIVNRPTLAVVGESGPEAVIPLGGGSNDLIGEIRSLRSAILQMAKRPIYMDGRKVTYAVAEQMEEIAYQ